MHLEVKLLKNTVESIPQLAKIWHEVLGKIWLTEVTIEQIETRFRNHLNSDSLPLTLVISNKDKAIGMCSLRKNDGIRPDLAPWLGSLVVDTAYQGRGIGKMLINAIKNKAKELGFSRLYLFAFDLTIVDWYAHLGWNKIGIDEFKGHKVTVMNIRL